MRFFVAVLAVGCVRAEPSAGVEERWGGEEANMRSGGGGGAAPLLFVPRAGGAAKNRYGNRYGLVHMKEKNNNLKEEVDVKALKLSERAMRSSKRRMYNRIPDDWGSSSMVCDVAPTETDPFVVALASDEQDPLPIFAAMNSTISNAAEPAKLSFVVVVTRSAQRGLSNLVRRYIESNDDAVPRARPRVSICVGLEEQLRNRPAMKTLAALGNSSRVKRKELLSSFNFAAFYLPHILKNKRILYLDSDVIVRSDVGELADMPMDGMPAAAVEDCTQRISKYIDFPLAAAYRRAALVRVETLFNDGCASTTTTTENNASTFSESDENEEDDSSSRRRRTLAAGEKKNFLPHCEPAPRDLPPNTTCVFNRGVLVLNRAEWLKERLAEHIERHVIDYVHCRGALFRSGVSQPPFLLALGTQYFKLPGDWNVRGLGRDAIGGPEWRVIAMQTRQAYPKFMDFEHDLADYMRVVAKARLLGDERRKRGEPFLSTSQQQTQMIQEAQLEAKAHLPPSENRPRFSTWRTRVLTGGAKERPTDRLLEAPSRQPGGSWNAVDNPASRILQRLDAPSEATHRGAAAPDKYKNHYPYVCPNAIHAKILHFNGEIKPWRMPAATVTHFTPSEGALCLWHDISGPAQHKRNDSAFYDLRGGKTNHNRGRHKHNNNNNKRRLSSFRSGDDYGHGATVAEQMSSCALDWHRYVTGYVTDLRRETDQRRRDTEEDEKNKQILDEKQQP